VYLYFIFFILFFDFTHSLGFYGKSLNEGCENFQGQIKDRNVTPELKAKKFTPTFRDCPNCCPPYALFCLRASEEFVELVVGGAAIFPLGTCRQTCYI
jgi:hypothetical protein